MGVMEYRSSSRDGILSLKDMQAVSTSGTYQFGAIQVHSKQAKSMSEAGIRLQNKANHFNATDNNVERPS
jgi:hypothetical protein